LKTNATYEVKGELLAMRRLEKLSQAPANEKHHWTKTGFPEFKAGIDRKTYGKMESTNGARFKAYTIEYVCKALELEWTDVIRTSSSSPTNGQYHAKGKFSQATPLHPHYSPLNPPLFIDRQRVSLFRRQLNIPDKVEEISGLEVVRQFLFDRSKCYSSRPYSSELTRYKHMHYVAEDCYAQNFKCLSHHGGREFLFSFWISEMTAATGELRLVLLLEDGPPITDNFRYSSYSTFSALLPLIHECRAKINLSKVRDSIRNAPFPNEYAQFTTDDHPPFLEQYYNLYVAAGAWNEEDDWDDNGYNQFATNWKAFLPAIGFQPYGELRRIYTIYYIRFGDDVDFYNPANPGNGVRNMHIYGYPLCILPLTEES